jgi:hypothetical protein
MGHWLQAAVAVRATQAFVPSQAAARVEWFREAVDLEAVDLLAADLEAVELGAPEPGAAVLEEALLFLARRYLAEIRHCPAYLSKSRRASRLFMERICKLWL